MKFFKIFLCLALMGSFTQVTHATDLHPHIRVGLYTTIEPIIIQADKPVSVMMNKKSVQTTLAGESVTLSYDPVTKLYQASSANWNYTSSTVIRLTPLTKPTILTITNYNNTPTWNTDLNDNAFLGSLELNYASTLNQIWVVNSVGIENYVKGVAEAGNDNPPAYLQALYTAARSYAYFNYLHPTKHAGEPYLLNTTPNDQVYRGYNFTQRAPNITAAVIATRGQIVTYHNEPVVTPYFSQSDGRTRSWAEVWNGNQTYLISKPDPCCTTNTMLGHGVGMSAKGARYFAEQGWNATKILQYYYTDITIEKKW